MRNIEPDSEEHKKIERDCDRYVGGLKLQHKLQMAVAWFTFGQTHVHSVNGITFDKDCVVKIESKDPRQTMFDTFGPKWAMQYDEEPDLRYYPRGVIEL